MCGQNEDRIKNNEKRTLTTVLHLVTLFPQLRLRLFECVDLLFPHLNLVLDVGAPLLALFVAVIGALHAHQLEVVGSDACFPVFAVDLDQAAVFELFSCEGGAQADQETRVDAERRRKERTREESDGFGFCVEK